MLGSNREDGRDGPFVEYVAAFRPRLYRTAYLLCGDAHCFAESVIERDRLAAAAVAALTAQPVASGTVLMPDEILLDRLRAAFRGEAIRSACAGCEWSDLCSRVAAEGYPGVQVGQAPASGR